MSEMTTKLQERAYKLVNTVTGEVVTPSAILNASEVFTLNYAYAVNGSSLRWRLT